MTTAPNWYVFLCVSLTNHNLLQMLACGCKPPDESLEHAKQSLIPIEDDTSWVDKLATTIVIVPPAATAVDGPAAHNGAEKYRRMIINSVKRWTCDNFVESSDLIRDMFALLLRQYNGVTEVWEALEWSYDIVVLVLVRSCDVWRRRT